MVTEAHAVRPSNSELARAAVAAVKKWKYTPGKRNGVVVKTRMHAMVDFELNP